MQIGRPKGRPPKATGIRARGTITRLVVGQSYGFIRLTDRRTVFFHRSDVRDGTAFNNLGIGDAVRFELILDPISGPRAIEVAALFASKDRS